MYLLFHQIFLTSGKSIDSTQKNDKHHQSCAIYRIIQMPQSMSFYVLLFHVQYILLTQLDLVLIIKNCKKKYGKQNPIITNYHLTDVQYNEKEMNEQACSSYQGYNFLKRFFFVAPNMLGGLRNYQNSIFLNFCFMQNGSHNYFSRLFYGRCFVSS